MAQPTVTVTAGSTSVVGSGLTFLALEGDLFVAAGLSVAIAASTADALTLQAPWPGASGTTEYFTVANVAPAWSAGKQTYLKVNELLARIAAGLPLPVGANGPLAGRAGYNNRAEGFVYLATAPLPWRLYVKQTGENAESAWSLGQEVTAPAQSTVEAEAARDAAQASAGIASDKAGQATAAAGAATGAAATTTADRAQTGQDRAATAGDRVQTGLDRTQTSGDRVQTQQDRTATGQDRIATAADRVQAGQDRTATGQDRAQTGLDRVQTGQDAGATGAALAQSQTAAGTAKAEADRAAATRQAVDAVAAAAGSGPASTLLYPALAKALVAATDVVDLFVYDTRLDSDGGEWRNKCAHLSWFNEALGTATRGMRREFPLVAGLVLRQTDGVALSVYDLTDLDTNGLPRLWLVSTRRTSAGSSGPALGLTSTVLRGVYASNGHIWIASNGGLFGFDFANDGISLRAVTGLSRRLGGIAGRNAFGNGDMGYTSVTGATGIVSSDVNAVHARVLPGAPLNAAGLPIPTVAVASGAGVSVIHSTGFVANVTYAGGYSKIMLTPDGRVWAQYANGDTTDVGSLPYASTVANTAWRTGYYRSGNSITSAQIAANTALPMVQGAFATKAVAPGAIGHVGGLSLIAEDTAAIGAGMVHHVTTGSVTGFQAGDIRLAALGEATTGNVVGATIANETFDTDTSGYAQLFGSVTWNAGKLRVASDGTNAGRAGKAYTLIPGEAYRVSVDAALIQGGGVLHASTSGSTGNSFANVQIGQSGSPTLQFIAPQATVTIILQCSASTAGNTVDFDSLRIELAVPDRSYKAKPLTVVGTLSRTPVATGADLTAISGFSAANYLEQPYNADLDFGTGDLCIEVWNKRTGGSAVETLVYRGNAAATTQIQLLSSASGLPQISAPGSATISLSQDLRDGLWHKIEGIRRAGVIELWVDGVRAATVANTTNLSDAVAVLRIGARADGTNPAANSSISLVRISAYAPTPAQIAKKYREESVLFQDNAKCFLGGTSNAVADLDVDTARNALVVATGDGVSEFVGLRRTAYLDTASVAPLTNDTMKAASSQAGFRLLAGGAQVVAQRDPVVGVDEMARYGPRLALVPRATGVTTDATPLVLAPRLFIGEREVVSGRTRIIGRQYGATAADAAEYVIEWAAKRDAGGNVVLIASTTTVINEITASMDAAMVVDAVAQTISAQVTGRAGTRIVWLATTMLLSRQSEDLAYAA